MIIINKDILDLDLEKIGLHNLNYKIIANIPYYITGQILKKFLGSKIQPLNMVLMVQKEVADRITAKDGKESILSLSVKIYGTPHNIKKVPARYFLPKPKVDSEILLINNISKRRLKNTSEERSFFELIKIGFLHKRKFLFKNLQNNYTKQEISRSFTKCNISEKSRAEELKIDQWICLNKTLQRK